MAQAEAGGIKILVDFSPDIYHIVFEKGLEIELRDNKWVAIGQGSIPIDCSPSDILSKYKLYPLIISRNVRSFEQHFLVSINTLQPLEVRATAITQLPSFLNQNNSEANLNLHYIVNAIIYHCYQLVVAYSNVCRNFLRYAPSDYHPTSQFIVSAYQYEPYFVFEAFINSIMRFYSMLRYTIWYAFGDRGSAPNSFERVLTKCEGNAKIPEKFKKRLNENWNEFGKIAKDYRDCIEHYHQICHFMPFSMMEKLDLGIWVATSRIPDNPQERSANKFKYERNIDALSYSWKLTNEVISLAEDVFQQLPA